MRLSALTSLTLDLRSVNFPLLDLKVSLFSQKLAILLHNINFFTLWSLESHLIFAVSASRKFKLALRKMVPEFCFGRRHSLIKCRLGL